MSITFHFPSFVQKQFEPSAENFLKENLNLFEQTINSPDFGFYKITETERHLNACQELWQNYSHITKFVHIGIGGSSLGPEALINALDNKSGVHFTFINNVDPDEINDQLRDFEPEKTCFYIVSKSGGTAETMASLSIVINKLEQLGIKKEDLKKYLIFCTDPVSGDLRALAHELSIPCLEIPTNVGGRFSIFTSVGLLPGLAAGLDMKSFLSGANTIKENFLSLDQNPLLQSAEILFELKKQRQVHETVLMPYSSKLKDVSAWFVQLWAESLGKKLDLSGKEVHEGFTPIPAYGATDQHSQVQLFMEGPYNKLLILLEVEQFNHELSLKNSIDRPSFQKLSGHTLNKLIKAELQGTQRALEESHRPYMKLTLAKRDEYHVGSVLMYLESLTALMGHFLRINPFDQPGVEAGKKYAFEYLAK